MKVDDKEFQNILNENQVLKSMIKTLYIFSESSSMTYEAYYKTMSGIILEYENIVVEKKLTDLDVVKKSINFNIEDDEKENSALG